jgi:hypothetical protein
MVEKAAAPRGWMFFAENLGPDFAGAEEEKD